MPERTELSDPARDASTTGAIALPVLASDLRMVVAQIIRRFRQDRTIPQPQLAALAWLNRRGALTTSDLAAIERVRPQSMAHTVAELEGAGLVGRQPDPADKRKTLISLSAEGQTVIDEFLKKGESWVAAAVEAKLTPDEQVELARGVELLGRLIDDE